MNQQIHFYQLSELPTNNFQSGKIFECIGRRNFILIYDLVRSVSILGFSDPDAENIKDRICKEISGINFLHIDAQIFDDEENLSAFSIYRKADEFDSRHFHDIFDVLPKDGFVSILFLNSTIDEINSSKLKFESLLSSKRVKESESSLKTQLSNKINSTTHRDLYYESEEKIMLNVVIESLNKAILSNGLAYKIFLVIPKSDILRKYIDTHFLVLEEYSFYNKNINGVIDYLFKRPSLPFGVDHLKEYLNFYGFYNVNHTLLTPLPLQEDGIEIGNFVKDGVGETDLSIKVDPSAINLGFIITGLPGSGKTREAMAVLDSLAIKKGNNCSIFIITPTKEWKDFALAHDMFFIKFYEDNIPINFFRCPETIEIEKFYTNLAMILSSAANAGPYQNPMEKCMLNAFRKVYRIEREPDPIKVYNEIEESIIRYHGKRTATGIKYTKHGENIKSALENLRGIISKQQYCVKKGIRIEDFVKNGCVFDVSSTSGNTMTQLYALILNQIYSITSNFDTNGDEDLRIVICLEEAQTIFKESDSPAVEDVKQRIQDFRKQGVGLILLTHNVTDIDIGIRRLCQLKLYLKQAPDTALIASKDLIFSNVEQEEVVLKLKILNSRLGAFSYVSKNGKDKRQQDTIFIKSKIYELDSTKMKINPITDYIDSLKIRETRLINCKIEVGLAKEKETENFSQTPYYIKIDFLGEELAMIPISYLESDTLQLLEDKEYSIYILNKNNRVLKKFLVNASEKIFLDIYNLNG